MRYGDWVAYERARVQPIDVGVWVWDRNRRARGLVIDIIIEVCDEATDAIVEFDGGAQERVAIRDLVRVP